MAGWIFQPLPAAGQEDAAAAGSAPGWDTQPVLITRAPAIARAVAAAVVTAGIDAAFVPPAAPQTPPWGLEAPPRSAARRVHVARAESQALPPRAARPFGLDGQPGVVRRRGVPRTIADQSFPPRIRAVWSDAQPLVVRQASKLAGPGIESGYLYSAAAAQAAYEHLTEQPGLVVWHGRASVVSDAWPVDAVQVAQQPIAGGFDSQPASALSRKVRIGTQNASGPLDVTQQAAVAADWGFDAQPPRVWHRSPATDVGDSVPLEELGDVPAEPPPPPVLPPPPSGGSILAGRSSGRWVRVSDGSEIHLRADDVTVYVQVDRAVLGAEELQAVVGVLVDPVAVGGIVHLSAAASVTQVVADSAPLGRDDLPEVLRLVRMSSQAPKSAPPVASDVRGIWALIDALKGKKK